MATKYGFEENIKEFCRDNEVEFNVKEIKETTGKRRILRVYTLAKSGRAVDVSFLRSKIKDLNEDEAMNFVAKYFSFAIDRLIEDIKEVKEENEDLLKPIADRCKEEGVRFKRVVLQGNLDNSESNVIIKFEFTKGTNRANRIYRLSRLKDAEIELVLDNLERAIKEVL
ncbi:MAG: hypothetical protein ACI3T9_00570 [Romboutsia timonensis]